MSVSTLLDRLHGRIRDVDSHEMTPAGLWSEVFGDVTTPVAMGFLAFQTPNHPNSFAVPLERDETPVRAEDMDSYWGTGCRAPGAFDLDRRLEWMDLAGIDQQILFGTGPCIVGQMLTCSPEAFLKFANIGFVEVPADFDARLVGQSLVAAHNDWAVKAAKASPRLRPGGVILTHSVRDAIAEAERLIDAGIRVAQICSSIPPDGRSPAHPDTDPLWRTFADADVPVILHIGGEYGFLATEAWTDAPLFESNTEVPTELQTDPFTFSTNHFSSVNFLASLVMGGVFERVPNLRLGFIEQNAHWVGPAVENMNMWAEQFARRLTGQLSLRPSDYVERNVRVTPFSFEPVDRYVERFGLEDVYCFGSDYPHYEGGKDPMGTLLARLERLGPSFIDKFFVTNAELLMPA